MAIRELEKEARERIIGLTSPKFLKYLKVPDCLHKLSEDVDRDGPIVGTFEFLGTFASGTIGGALGV